MNILLTGGLGYIGSHTAVVLAQAGHRVVLLDNLSNSRADVADRIGRIIGQRPVVEIADVLETARRRDHRADQALQAQEGAGARTRRRTGNDGGRDARLRRRIRRESQGKRRRKGLTPMCGIVAAVSPAAWPS